jgi:hypothetical protein
MIGEFELSIQLLFVLSRSQFHRPLSLTFYVLKIHLTFTTIFFEVFKVAVFQKIKRIKKT